MRTFNRELKNPKNYLTLIIILMITIMGLILVMIMIKKKKKVAKEERVTKE